MFMYANLANRSHSNHGYLTFISEGDVLGLSERAFKTESFNQKSWEATIWFCEMTPSYLRHNLYKETVVQTSLLLRQPATGSKRENPDLKSISGFPDFPNFPGGGGSIVSLGQSRFPRFPTARHEFPCGLVVLKGPQLPQDLGDVASNGCGQDFHGLNDSLWIDQEMTAKI